MQPTMPKPAAYTGSPLVANLLGAAIALSTGRSTRSRSDRGSGRPDSDQVAGGCPISALANATGTTAARFEVLSNRLSRLHHIMRR